MIILRLPIPPSVNGLYFNRGKSGGRGKTSNYRRWIKEADQWFMMQKHKLRGVTPITGKCDVAFRLPKIVGDASNRIKAAEDYLVSRNITGDDKNNHRVSIEIDEQMETRELWVTVKEIA